MTELPNFTGLTEWREGKGAMELRGQVRSQMEFGNEGTLASCALRAPGQQVARATQTISGGHRLAPGLFNLVSRNSFCAIAQELPLQAEVIP